MFKEIDNLKKLDHPNILRMYEIFEDHKRYYVVTDICQGGELFDEIVKRKQFNEEDTAVLIRQVLSCINYCHTNNLVHRDLKPENILIESAQELNSIKIIDFASAVKIKIDKENEGTSKITERTGTPYYIAPEVLK